MALLLLPPNIPFSESSWGPQGEATPLFDGIPYAPFSKTERLCKAADWMNINRTHTTRSHTSVATAFNDFEEDDEDEFSLVDNRLYKSGVQRRTFARPQKYTKPGSRVKGGTNYQLQGKRPTKIQQRTLNPAKRKNQKRGGGGNTNTFQPKNKRRTEPTVEIASAWGEPVSLGEYKSIELNVLRQCYATPPEVETLSAYGKLEEFNPDYSDMRKPIQLDRHWALERTFHNVTTSDDPILSKLLNDKVGNVYATDGILAVLMSAVVSIYSWDLKVKVIDNGDEEKILVFDKRDGSFFDYIDVNENSNETPLDEDETTANTVENLSREALGLNWNFSQQILYKSEAQTFKFPKSNPFPSQEEKPASTAYFYRSFVLEDDIKIVARTEVNSYKSVKGRSKPDFLFVRALNEYDPKITGGWRKILESQKGGAFATELKNNNCKITKWLAQAHLAGASNIKLGYVARISPKDNYCHSILDVTDFSVDELAQELGTTYERLWGSVKHVIDSLRLLDAGEYCLLRDPTKKSLVVYKMD